jgi:hypothetical protein
MHPVVKWLVDTLVYLFKPAYFAAACFTQRAVAAITLTAPEGFLLVTLAIGSNALVSSKMESIF